jgi:acetyltransferase-like isoleucine patch superfamily enzyme
MSMREKLRRLRAAGVGRMFSLGWGYFWMVLAGRVLPARLAMRFASWWTRPFYGRSRLARWNRRGFLSPEAVLDHGDLRLGAHVVLDDRVLIFEDTDGGPVTLGDRVHLWRDVTIQTGYGGSVTIRERTHIQPRCQLTAYRGSILIGAGAHIAPGCAFYPYDHGTDPGQSIGKQPLETRGGIVVEDDAWLGYGVIVLDGVRIGRGAIVGAGSVVTRNVPDGAIAVGVPARVMKMRDGSRPPGSDPPAELAALGVKGSNRQNPL